MADAESDHSSTMERVAPGHWRRTYTKDGLVTDLHDQFQSVWFDLTDFALIEGMAMVIKGVSYFDEDEKYSQSEFVTATGHLDNASFEHIDRQESDPWRINVVDVTLLLDRAWNDPPIKKWSREGHETEETWTLGQSQAGHLFFVDGRILPHDRDDPFLHLYLKMPRDFLPQVRQAVANPEGVGRIRLGAMIKLFEEGAQGAFAEPWDHKDYMFDREHQSTAYLTGFSFETRAVLPTPRKPVEDGEVDHRPPAIRHEPQMPPPPPTFGREIALAIRWCAMAAAAIAVILLMK